MTGTAMDKFEIKVWRDGEKFRFHVKDFSGVVASGVGYDKAEDAQAAADLQEQVLRERAQA